MSPAHKITLFPPDGISSEFSTGQRVSVLPVTTTFILTKQSQFLESQHILDEQTHLPGSSYSYTTLNDMTGECGASRTWRLFRLLSFVWNVNAPENKVGLRVTGAPGSRQKTASHNE